MSAWRVFASFKLAIGGLLGDSNTKPLVFLGTCLAFAEAALGTLAGFTDADATIVAAMALASLGMVLLALVVMYIREPAFLTFTGQQALDLRMLQEIVGNLPPELVNYYLGSLIDPDVQRGHSAKVARAAETTEQDAEDVERDLGLLNSAENEAEN